MSAAAPRPQPAWLECFCGSWEEGVAYSTSGPWWSERFLDQMLEAAADGDARGRSSSGKAAAAAAAAARGAGAGASPSSPTAAARERPPPSRVADILSTPTPLGPPAASSSSSSSRTLDAPALAECARWYAANPGEARAALVRTALEQVAPHELPALLPPTLTGADTGLRWFRLRQRVDFESAPGLAGWLTDTHDRLDRENGLSVASLLALISSGGDTGTVGLARPPPKGHPLSKDARALCSFYRRGLPKATPLGFYPGLHSDMRDVEAMMGSLPLTPEEALAAARGGGGGGGGGSAMEGAPAPQTSSTSSSAAAAADGGSSSSSAAAASAPDGAAAASSSSSASFLAPYSSTPSARDPRGLMCRSLVWSYDFGAPPLPQLGRAFTFQGTFVRNVLSGINDYHRIGDGCVGGMERRGARDVARAHFHPPRPRADLAFLLSHRRARRPLTYCPRSPNVSKVPLVLGGLLPVVVFVTNRAVEPCEEALLEYGKDWYDTFCRYVPAATGQVHGGQTVRGPRATPGV
jgi:hypothetical protein